MRGPLPEGGQRSRAWDTLEVGLAARNETTHAGDCGHPAGRAASGYVSKTGRAPELRSSRGPRGCREPGQKAVQGGQAGLRAER